MLRNIRHILSLMISFSLCMTTFAQDDPIKVELQSNKKEYICGEPVLLKTSVTNTSGNSYVLNEVGYEWLPKSFRMFVAYNSDEFVDILSIKARTSGGDRLGIVAHSGNYERPFIDENYLPNSLEGNQRVERIDFILMSRPGDYKIKSVLEDRLGKSKTYESEPISFKVVSLSQKADSISKLGDPNLIALKLGKTIWSAHFSRGEGYAYDPSPDGPIGTAAFEKIAPEIIEKNKDSVFREYILYADIAGHRNNDSYSSLPEKYKERAFQFEKEYPDSWLLPQVYVRLTNTYIAEKNREKAEEYKQKALKLAPNDRGLTGIRQMDLDKLLPKTNNQNTNKQ
jgi:hypothetical protein